MPGLLLVLVGPKQNSSEPLVAIDRDNKDGRAANLHVDRIRHVELAGFHHRWQRIDILGPRVAILADHADHLINLLILHTNEKRRIPLPQKAAGAFIACRTMALAWSTPSIGYWHLHSAPPRKLTSCAPLQAFRYVKIRGENAHPPVWFTTSTTRLKIVTLGDPMLQATHIGILRR